MAVKIIAGQIKLGSLNKGQVLSLIHGGAGPEDPKGDEAKNAAESLLNAFEDVKQNPLNSVAFLQGQKLCEADRTCLSLLHRLERDPIFNSGIGAALQRDGVARVSASFMGSEMQKFSAVINMEEIANPCLLAFYLQSQKYCVLDGNGAEALRRSLNISRDSLTTQKRLQHWKGREEKERHSLTHSDSNHFRENTMQPDGKGTVGAVCVDWAGRLCASTSTGGVGFETVGRVGDTPTVAGNFCSDSVAISCTGYGEQILTEGFSVKVATRVKDGFTLVESLQRSFEEAESKNFDFACISTHLNKNEGVVYWAAASLSPFFVWAFQGQKSQTFLDFV